MNELIIKNFFSITKTKVKLIEEVRRYYGRETSPLFNSFDFWDINENKVSEIFAFFLNPSANHEQGDIYLRHFLKKFSINSFYFVDKDNIDVQCEFRCDNNKRIDIIIIKNDFEQAIGIENKIYSDTTDQVNQLSDYIHFLQRKTKDNFTILYLSPQVKNISEISLSKEDKMRFQEERKLLQLNYEEHIIDCVKEFTLLTENIRVKSFLKDFEKTLVRMYLGENNMDTKQIIIDYINEDIKNLEISFLISRSLQEIKQELKTNFQNEISEIASELNIKEISPLKLQPSNWKSHFIVFSYESGGILLGMTRKYEDYNKPRFCEIENMINEKMNIKFNVSPWWSMWQFFYQGIENNEQFYKDIITGKIKESAKEFIKLINDNFNTNKY